MITEEAKQITVLGKIFNSEAERRQYFREELRKHLPDLKKMEGFPIGEDEDIINLSDPPFYTACPNPWLNDFVTEWEEEKKKLEKEGKRDVDFIVNKPYSADVSEGKNNPIYNAHTYHTKVPHPAIMRYILHYTEPGDIIFDGFAGTGMTGVAAGLCGIERDVFNLGELNANIGVRHAICSDLSPIASFISSNLNRNFDVFKEFNEAKIIVNKLIDEFGKYYKVKFKDKEYFIEYSILSEVFYCESCQVENDYLGSVLNEERWCIENEFICQNCGALIKKSFKNKVFKTSFDVVTQKTRRINTYIPKYYKLKGHIGLIHEDECEFLHSYQSRYDQMNHAPQKVIAGVKTNDAIRLGRDFIHLFYSDINFMVLNEIWNQIKQNRLLRFVFTSVCVKNLSLLNNMSFRNGGVNLAGALPNAIYFPSNIADRNVLLVIKRKLEKLAKYTNPITNSKNNNLVSLASSTELNVKSNSIDYIFIDPPFGANLMYSELNFIWEAWIKVKTDNTKEAIINSKQNKKLFQYQALMEECFCEFYRILKHGNWMTVVFSNTSASVWNSLQNVINKSGFVIANVSALDKKHGTFNAKTTATAVKQDLAISCYKPSSAFDEKFKRSQQTDIAVWDFVEEHLQHLPVHLTAGNSTTAIIERSPKILFDRLIAFYVQKGLPVPIDAGKFQQGLRERFIERDGMFFTNEQVQEYDKKKKENPEFIQLSILVSSEQDGVLWLKDLLTRKPLAYQDIQPLWMQALAGVRKGDVIPELAIILEENFLKDNSGKWYTPDPENEADLEKLRTKRLLRQFDNYKEEALKPKTKRIKEVRVEALRAGFKQCYQDKDFQTIVTIGDKIPNNLLMEDEVLLQFYDIASSKV